MEGASQAVVGSSEQKIPASLSLFLKSERIPVLLNEGKGPEYRLLHDFQPVPLAYQPRAQISNHVYSGPFPIHNCYSGLSTGLATGVHGQVSVVHCTDAFSSAEF
jgi:hypothetical protein